jgi:hypothetical protein
VDNEIDLPLNALTKAERRTLYGMLRPVFSRTQAQEWAAGEVLAQRIVIDAVQAPSLYFIEATGENVTFSLTWGGNDQSLENLIPPLTATLPGQLQLKAVQVNNELPAFARASIARVYGSCCVPLVRRISTAAETLQSPVFRATALTAGAQLTPPAMAAVALAAGASFPVVPGTVVTSGTFVLDLAI